MGKIMGKRKYLLFTGDVYEVWKACLEIHRMSVILLRTESSLKSRFLYPTCCGTRSWCISRSLQETKLKLFPTGWNLFPIWCSGSIKAH